MGGLNFGVDSGLWVEMAKHIDKPQKVADLAATLGIDPVLLGAFHASVHMTIPTNVPTGRLMRHLGAMGYLIEVGADEYRSTNYTKALSLPVIGNGYLAM